MILRLFEKIAASLLTIFIGTMDQFEWKLIFFYPDFGIQFNFFSVLVHYNKYIFW